VLDHARQVVALTLDLVDWSGRMRSSSIGRVRLGLIDVAAVVHYPDVVRAFIGARRDVHLTMSVAPSADLLVALRAGELDLVACVEPAAPIAGIETEPLFEEPLHVVAPPGTEIGKPDTWGPWLTFPASSHTRRVILDALRRRRAPITIAAESHQPTVLAQMARLGLGWTVLPVDELPADLAIGPELTRRRLVLARRAGSVSDPAVDDLASALRNPSPRSRRRRR
jgi:DNA-binding transcriptional LysR family regulator